MKFNLRNSLIPLILAAVTTVSVDAQQRATEQSVRPGINESFLDPNLKVAEWLQRFEVESCEIFHSRQEILAACQIKEGMTVADIGAGTGLYTRLLSQQTGPSGWVYAVEITPRFLEHILTRAKAEHQRNISVVLCPQDSVSLPPNSVDKVFICDTYHHFEFPQDSRRTTSSASEKAEGCESGGC